MRLEEKARTDLSDSEVGPHLSLEDILGLSTQSGANTILGDI